MILNCKYSLKSKRFQCHKNTVTDKKLVPRRNIYRAGSRSKQYPGHELVLVTSRLVTTFVQEYPTNIVAALRAAFELRCKSRQTGNFRQASISEMSLISRNEHRSEASGNCAQNQACSSASCPHQFHLHHSSSSRASEHFRMAPILSHKEYQLCSVAHIACD
jgi:hypothetical protein